jgi:hypothetical protein
MAAAHGKDSVITIATQNISPYVKTVDFNRSQDANDTTTKGAEGKTYRAGLTDGEIRLTGLWDDTATSGSRTVLQALLDSETTTTFEWGAEGNTTGMMKDSGAAVLTQYDESSPVDDMVAFTATLKISGAVTTGTYA